jgi:hypothetical protein
MHNWFRRLFPLGLLFWSTGQGSEPVERLDELRWASRVLLVFAVDDQDPRVTAISESIREARCDVAERDLVFGRVLLTGESRIGENALSVEAAARLRGRFQPDRQGRWGQIKLRQCPRPRRCFPVDRQHADAYSRSEVQIGAVFRLGSSGYSLREYG